MSVIRNKYDRHFTVLPNELLQRTDMHRGAKGLLLEMLSFPADWEFSMAQLQTDEHGRDWVQKRMKELVELGYVKQIRGTDEQGRFTYDYEVYSEPQTSQTDHRNGKTVDGKTVNGKPVDNKRHFRQSTKDQQSTSYLRSKDLQPAREEARAPRPSGFKPRTQAQRCNERFQSGKLDTPWTGHTKEQAFIDRLTKAWNCDRFNVTQNLRKAKRNVETNGDRLEDWKAFLEETKHTPDQSTIESEWALVHRMAGRAS